MTVSARLYAEGSDRVEDVPIASVTARVDDRSILWIDTDGDATSLAEIEERLGLGDAIRGIVSGPRGRAASRSDHLRFSITGLKDARQRAEEVRLDVILARNIVVSVHADPIRGLADPIDIVAEDPRFGRVDAGRFAGLLLDGVLDGFDAAVEELEHDIDRLDAHALSRDPREDLLPTMVELRGRIAALRRWLAPSRAVFAALTRPVDEAPSPIGTPDSGLVAHLERTLDGIERCREQLLDTFDIVMTRTNQRTNDVVRILTVVSAVLLPAVVIAGIMGMNFQAELFDHPDLFYVVIGAMLALAVATLAFARWRGWI